MWPKRLSRLNPPFRSPSAASRQFHYKAFISYKHGILPAFTPRFEEALKSYGKPRFKFPPRIFRDEPYLAPGVDLPRLIEDALDDSEFLLLLASPDAAASNWVSLELDRWCHHLGRTDKLVIVLIAGDIVVDSVTRAIEWSKTTALPRSLERYVTSVPLYVDLRRIATAEPTLDDPEFKNAINKIVARFRGITPTAMLGQEIREHRRALRFRNGAIAALAALTVGLGWALSVALTQQRIALGRQREAVARQLAAVASLTFGEAPRFSERALLLALESLALEPQNGPAASFLARNTSLLSRPLWSYGGDEGYVGMAVWAPDARSLAVAPRHRVSIDRGPIEILDASTGTRSPLSPDQDAPEQSERLWGALFSPDSRTLFWFGLDGLVAYEPASKRYRWTLSQSVRALTRSFDGLTLAATIFGRNPECVLLSADDGVVLKRLKGLCQDDTWRSRIAVADGRSVSLYEWPRGRLLAKRKFSSEVRQVLFDPGERRLVMAGEEPHTIAVLEAPSWRSLWSLKRDSRINDLKWAANSSALVVAFEDGRVENVDVRSGMTTKTFDHAGSVSQLAVSPDGDILATASTDGTARVFHLPSGIEMRRIPHMDPETTEAPGNYVRSVGWNENGQRLAVGTWGSGLSVFAFDRAGVFSTIAPPQGEWTAQLTTGGRYLAACISTSRFGDTRCQGGRFVFWNVGAKRPLFEEQIQERGYAVMSADGSTLVMQDDDVLRIKRTDGPGDSRIQRQLLDGPAAVSDDGSLVAIQPQWGFQEIVHVDSGKTIWRNQTINNACQHLLFNPSGAQLALGHWYSDTELVNVADGSIVTLAETRQVKRIAFSRDGRVVAIGGVELKLFETVTGRLLWRVPTSLPVRAIGLNSDGSKLLLASTDNTVRLLGVRAGGIEEMLRIPFPHLPVEVAFDHDDKHIVTVSGGLVWRHLWRRSDLLAAGCAATQRPLTSIELPERLAVDRPPCLRP